MELRVLLKKISSERKLMSPSHEVLRHVQSKEHIFQIIKDPYKRRLMVIMAKDQASWRKIIETLLASFRWLILLGIKIKKEPWVFQLQELKIKISNKPLKSLIHSLIRWALVQFRLHDRAFQHLLAVSLALNHQEWECPRTYLCQFHMT